MDSEHLEIRCSRSGSRLLFSGDPRRLSATYECKFRVALESRYVSASAVVDDSYPGKWSELFAELARDWRGWSGERARESLEGQFRLSATSDSLGHVSLRVRVRDDVYISNLWVEYTLFLEAGQLESVAKNALRFFSMTTRPLP